MGCAVSCWEIVDCKQLSGFDHRKFTDSLARESGSPPPSPACGGGYKLRLENWLFLLVVVQADLEGLEE
jgi:hypothetical protein